MFIRTGQPGITCRICGTVDKESLPVQADFCCTNCEFAENADLNAGVVIAFKALWAFVYKGRKGKYNSLSDFIKGMNGL